MRKSGEQVSSIIF